MPEKKSSTDESESPCKEVLHYAVVDERFAHIYKP